jgi:uracil-DNA glycosylase
VDFPEAGLRLFGVYHPSQQNTQTGLVTPAMYAKVLRRVRLFLDQGSIAKTKQTEPALARERRKR